MRLRRLAKRVFIPMFTGMGMRVTTEVIISFEQSDIIALT